VRTSSAGKETTTRYGTFDRDGESDLSCTGVRGFATVDAGQRVAV
jgi:hypothetical protein